MIFHCKRKSLKRLQTDSDSKHGVVGPHARHRLRAQLPAASPGSFVTSDVELLGIACHRLRAPAAAASPDSFCRLEVPQSHAQQQSSTSQPSSDSSQGTGNSGSNCHDDMVPLEHVDRGVAWLPSPCHSAAGSSFCCGTFFGRSSFHFLNICVMNSCFQ